jgi:hypothetical protein
MNAVTPRNSDHREIEWEPLRLWNYLSLLDLADQVQPTDLPPSNLSNSTGVSPFKVVHSSITESESMEKFRPKISWMKGRKSRHQFCINRKY